MGRLRILAATAIVLGMVPWAHAATKGSPPGGAAGETLPAETRPAASMPAETLPAASMPAESAPAESRPVIPDDLVPFLPDVSATATPLEVLIADPVRYELRVRHRRDFIVSFPATTELGDFEILPGERTHTVERDADGNMVVDVFVLQVAAFGTGELSIGSLEVPFLTPDGERYFVAAPDIPIKVKSLISNTPDAELKDVRPPLPLIEQDTLLVRVLLVVAGALALAGLALLAGWKARGMFATPPPPPPPPRPAHEIALERLEAIRRDQLIERGLADAFALRVSGTVREYIEGRFGFPALEYTTDEVLEELRNNPRPGVKYEAVRSFLHDTDLVKFARYPSSEPIMREHFAFAEGLVRDTMPRPEPDGAPTKPAPPTSGDGGAATEMPTGDAPAPVEVRS